MAVQFPGVDGSYYITQSACVNYTTADTFTIAAYVAVDDFAPAGSSVAAQYRTIMGGSYADNGCISLSLDAAASKIVWRLQGANYPASTEIDSGIFADDGAWHVVLLEVVAGSATAYRAAPAGSMSVQGSDSSALWKMQTSSNAAVSFDIGTGYWDNTIGQPKFRIEQVFIDSSSLISASKDSYANGASIDTLITPDNWWKLDATTNTAGYGSDNVDLNSTGSGKTTVSSPVFSPDTTAPILSSAQTGSVGVTTASASVSTDEGNGSLYWVVDTSATSPTVAQIQAGQNSSGVAADASNNQSVLAAGVQNVAVTNLIASTTYYAYFQQQDAVGNDSTVVASASFTTDAQDTTAPTLTSASSTNVGNTSATGNVSTDEASGTLYWIASTLSTAPTVAEIQAGQESGGALPADSGSQSVTTTGAQTVNVTSLSISTTYYLYFQQDDAVGNSSTVLTTSSFTTLNTQSLTVTGDFDSGTVDDALTTITNAGSTSPSVALSIRTPDDKWRQMYFKCTGAQGKRPTFSFGQTDAKSGINSDWSAWYSYDKHTWTHDQSGYTQAGDIVTFQPTSAFTQDTVYVAYQPAYPISNAKDLIDWLVANHGDKIHRIPSVGDTANWQCGTVPAQTDENGRTIPSQPLYAFGLWDSSSYPTDGKPKRTVVFMSGIHSGEHTGTWNMEGAIRYLVGGSANANELLQNFQFFVYPIANPSGRWGGASRESFANFSYGVNRDWALEKLPLQSVLNTAWAEDMAGRKVVAFFDFHGNYGALFGSEIAYVADSNWQVSAAKTNFMTALQTFGNYGEHVTTNVGLTNNWFHDNYACDYTFTPESAVSAFTLATTLDDIQLVGEHVVRAVNIVWSTESTDDFAFTGNYIAETLNGNGTPQMLDVSAYPWPPKLGDTAIKPQRGIGVDNNRHIRIDMGDYVGLGFLVISSAAYETNKDDTVSGANVVEVKTA